MNEGAITLLYTAHIEGKLELLPRLFTLIKRQREQAAGPVLLFDLGDTCAAGSWVCRATLGRAPLLVLDSMGYDLALVGAGEHTPIPPDSLRTALGSLGMRVALWGRPRELQRHDRFFDIITGPLQPTAEKPALVINRDAPTLPAVGTSPPILGDVPQGHLACVQVDGPDWKVQAAELIALADDTPRDGTIAAVVEFVESEARATRGNI